MGRTTAQACRRRLPSAGGQQETQTPNLPSPPVQRQRLVGGGLITVAEIAEGFEGVFQAAIRPEFEGVETVARHKEQLVAQYITYRAEFADAAWRAVRA